MRAWPSSSSSPTAGGHWQQHSVQKASIQRDSLPVASVGLVEAPSFCEGGKF